jgi:DNA-binding response OmpR family regulator
MTHPRVLVFDPDPEMLQLICAQLLEFGKIDVTGCSNVREVFRKLLDVPADLLITDSKVPETGLSGFLAQLEADLPGTTPSCIVVIADPGEKPDFSGLSSKDRVRVLPKPFDRAALLSIVRGSLKIAPSSGSRLLQIDDLILNPGSYDVHLSAERIHLTNSEFKLLFELMSNPDVILSRDHLIQKVQGEGIAVIDRAVDTHIFSLRKKLGVMGDRIETVRGMGYRLRSSSADC